MNRRSWAWVQVGPLSSREAGAALPAAASASATGCWFLGATASSLAAVDTRAAPSDPETADDEADPTASDAETEATADDEAEATAGDDEAVRKPDAGFAPSTTTAADETEAMTPDPVTADDEAEATAGNDDPPVGEGDDEAKRATDAARDGSTAEPVGALGRAVPGAAGVAAGTAASGWACRPCRLRRLIGQESTGGTPVQEGSSCGARTVGRGRRPIGA